MGTREMLAKKLPHVETRHLNPGLENEGTGAIQFYFWDLLMCSCPCYPTEEGRGV